MIGVGEAAVDHDPAERLTIDAARRAIRFDASEPMGQGPRQYLGASGKDVARVLLVRNDHGSQHMVDTFQNEFAFLDMQSSLTFGRAPEGNGCAEHFMRTLKENLLWVPSLATLDDPQAALAAFREIYSTTWLIERSGSQLPAETANLPRLHAPHRLQRSNSFTETVQDVLLSFDEFNKTCLISAATTTPAFTN